MNNDKVDFTKFIDPSTDTSVNVSEVSDISEACNNYLDCESRILETEQKLKDLKAELDQHNNTVVMLMEQRGVSEIKLTNGESVSYKPFYSASITKANQEEAFKWLRDNGHGDLIKNAVSVNFGKGEDDKAVELIGNLESQGMYPDQKMKVEPSTLRAFVGSEIEAGRDVPMDTFSIFIGNKVKIRKGK
tara:strand:+ start:1278 stop:1844 length:567 start_codon:yes stop_codon:yes gene_type:complete